MPIVRGHDLYLLSVTAIMGIVRRWPFAGARALAGVGIGSIAYSLSRSKRRRSEQHVQQAFADALTPEQVRAIVLGSFRHFWHDHFVPTEPVEDARRRVVGLQRVEQARRRGRGVILWESSVFGGRFAAKRLLRDAGIAIHQVHADNHLGDFETRGDPSLVRRAFLDGLLDRYELCFVTEIIRLRRFDVVAGRRALLRRLRENAIVCMGNDGAYGQRFVSVPFLGSTRYFATGLVTLARASGATLLPMFCIEAAPEDSQVVIEEPIDWDRTLDRDQAAQNVATQYAKLLESYVRRHPQQYRTWHTLGQHADLGLG